MAHIEKSVIIGVPPQKVFDYVASPATMHEWISGLIESKDLPEGPVTVGTAWTQIIRVAGRNIELRRWVTEYEPPSKIVWDGTMPGGGKATIISTLEPDNNKTKFTLFTFIMDYTFGGSFFGKLADKLLFERIADRDAAHNTVTLKTILESRESQ